MTKHLFFFSTERPGGMMLASMRHVEEAKLADGDDIVAHALPWQFCPAEVERQIYAASKKPSYWCVNGRVFLKLWPQFQLRAQERGVFSAELELSHHGYQDAEEWLSVYYRRPHRTVESITRCEFEKAMARVLADQHHKLITDTYRVGDAVKLEDGISGLVEGVVTNAYKVPSAVLPDLMVGRFDVLMANGQMVYGKACGELRVTFRKGGRQHNG